MTNLSGSDRRQLVEAAYLILQKYEYPAIWDIIGPVQRIRPPFYFLQTADIEPDQAPEPEPERPATPPTPIACHECGEEARHQCLCTEQPHCTQHQDVICAIRNGYMIGSQLDPDDYSFLYQGTDKPDTDTDSSAHVDSQSDNSE
jgi:hypothetical protein